MSASGNYYWKHGGESNYHYQELHETECIEEQMPIHGWHLQSPSLSEPRLCHRPWPDWLVTTNYNEIWKCFAAMHAPAPEVNII